MNEIGQENRGSRWSVILGGSLAVVLFAGIAGFMVYSSICPCERTPGGFLFGSAPDAPVDDWSFVNQVELCQIQIWAGVRPHSINLNCMSTPEGRLYLSCSVCGTKYWAARVGANESARIRLDGVVYPVNLNRVIDESEMDQAWRARDLKLNTIENPVGAPTPGAPRDPLWWTFRVTYRS